MKEKDTKEWLNNVKMEIVQAIRQNIVPDTFLLDVLSPCCKADFLVLQEDLYDIP